MAIRPATIKTIKTRGMRRFMPQVIHRTINRGQIRKVTAIAFAAVAIVVALRSADAAFFPQPGLRIAVNMTTIESFPVFLAAESFSRSKSDHAVELVPFPNGRAAMAALVSGAVEAATGSETQALINSVADPRIRIVTTLSECRYRIVARKSSGIRRVA